MKLFSNIKTTDPENTSNRPITEMKKQLNERETTQRYPRTMLFAFPSISFQWNAIYLKATGPESSVLIFLPVI